LSSGSGRGAWRGFDFAESAGEGQSSNTAHSSIQTDRLLHNPKNSEQGVFEDRQIVIGYAGYQSVITKRPVGERMQWG
jgi:hypothetical protein